MPSYSPKRCNFLSFVEIQETYKALKTRPSCDFILPDDWFYMPLLESYFWGCRQRTDGGESKIASTEFCQSDSEVCEAYIVHFLTLPSPNPPSRHNFRPTWWRPRPVWVGFIACWVNTRHLVALQRLVSFPPVDIWLVSAVLFWPIKAREHCVSTPRVSLSRSWLVYWRQSWIWERWIEIPRHTSRWIYSRFMTCEWKLVRAFLSA